MPSSSPRTGFGLAAIVIIVAMVGGSLWILSPPRQPRPSLPRIAIAPAPAAMPLPAAKVSADGGTTLLELPPTVASDQQSSEPDVAAESAAPLSAAFAPHVATAHPAAMPLGSGWVTYIAPPAGETGSAIPGAANASQSAGTVASNGRGLTIGILSGSGDDGGSASRSAVLSGGLRHAGWVLVEGGAAGSKSATRRAELFDPASLRWVGTGAMRQARENHTATILPDGSSLIAGGEGGKGAALASAELYDPARGKFSNTGAMKTARGGHTATLIAGCACAEDGKVLVAGGTTNLTLGTQLASAELYDPATGEFTPTGAMKSARTGATATLIASGPLAGDVLIAGGIGQEGASLASAELYDPRTGVFSETGAMTTARVFHTATWLGYLMDSGAMAGEILIAGGQTPAGVIASAEVYDPAAGTFSAIAPMTTARADHDAVLMTDGRVLLAGGFGPGEKLLNSAEIYNPADGTFAPAAAMTSVHAGADGVRLADGRVLIAGGQSSNADVYDPLTATFATTAPMRVALLDAPAVALP
jgi:Galactose oxidase, central domain/Kelch motif